MLNLVTFTLSFFTLLVVPNWASSMGPDQYNFVMVWLAIEGHRLASKWALLDQICNGFMWTIHLNLGLRPQATLPIRALACSFPISHGLA